VHLAKRKAKVWALDANESMLAYAQDKAAAAGVEVATIHGDMSDFEVQASKCGAAAAAAAMLY
jgi:ubiquinone/menaquinone biosynthesis C-methylase UbiE